MALSKVKNAEKQKILPETSKIEDSNSENDSGDESNGSGEGKSGWADSLAKVLSTTKPKTKKTLVLSRAKKIKTNDKLAPKKADYGFEVEGEEIKEEEKPVKEELDEKLKLRKNVHLDLRVKPSWQDIERERALRKIAQRGVVQLFNAVRIQQKDLQHQLDEAGPLDSRKDAVLNNINKRKFLDVLMGGKRAKSEAIDNPVKPEVKDESSDEDSEDDQGNKKKSEWSVLKDDFMTNKKNKHWDEESDSNNSGSNNDETDSDDNA